MFSNSQMSNSTKSKIVWNNLKNRIDGLQPTFTIDQGKIKSNEGNGNFFFERCKIY